MGVSVSKRRERLRKQRQHDRAQRGVERAQSRLDKKKNELEALKAKLPPLKKELRALLRQTAHEFVYKQPLKPDQIELAELFRTLKPAEQRKMREEVREKQRGQTMPEDTMKILDEVFEGQDWGSKLSPEETRFISREYEAEVIDLWVDRLIGPDDTPEARGAFLDDHLSNFVMREVKRIVENADPLKKSKYAVEHETYSKLESPEERTLMFESIREVIRERSWGTDLLDVKKDLEVVHATEENSPQERKRFGRVIVLTKRLVAGLLLAIQNAANFRERRVPAKAARRWEGKREEPAHRVVVVGSPIQVDCRAEIANYFIAHGPSRKGAPPTVQVLVRGHFKRQVVGVGRTGRKVIFVEPYWRGPEDAPIFTRPKKVG